MTRLLQAARSRPRVVQAPPAAAATLRRLQGPSDPSSPRCSWFEALFRDFGNRREIASYAGLAPSPWQSGVTRPRPGHRQGWQAAAQDDDPVGMAVGPASAGIGHQPTGSSSVSARRADACRGASPSSRSPASCWSLCGAWRPRAWLRRGPSSKPERSHPRTGFKLVRRVRAGGGRSTPWLEDAELHRWTPLFPSPSPSCKRDHGKGVDIRRM